MALPLDLAYYEIGKARRMKEVPGHFCKDDLIYIKNYRVFELYKRIDNRFVFSRHLLKHEIEDYYFNNGRSFVGCTIAEKV